MLIAIEGLIGVGKSTLQRQLGNHYDCVLLEQEFEKHPFLEKFYSDPQKYTLEKDMVFLFMSYHQLKHVDQRNKLVISDFIFDKSHVFSKLTLSEEDRLQLLEPSFYYLKPHISPPDLVIWLEASPEFVLNRIAIRGRKMESGVDTNYLSRLQIAYRELFETFTDCPVMTVKSESNDFLNNNMDILNLMRKIEAALPLVNSFRKK